MALARFGLRNLQHGLYSSSSSPSSLLSRSLNEKQRCASNILKRFSATATEKASPDGKSEGKEVAIDKKTKSPRRQRRNGPWRHNGRGFVPALQEIFPSGLGDALLQATENLNKLLENWHPSSLMGRVKEQDQCYKLRYELPGLTKEEVKITVEDGILTIKGEHKEEEEEGSDDEYWSSRSYGYHNTSLMLPDDAKLDDIKAEMKDGILTITVPRIERQGKDVKEIQIR